MVPIPKPLQSDIHRDFHFFVNTNILQPLGATTAGAGGGGGGGGRGASTCGPAPRGPRRDAIRPGHLLAPPRSSSSPPPLEAGSGRGRPEIPRNSVGKLKRAAQGAEFSAARSDVTASQAGKGWQKEKKPVYALALMRGGRF